MKGKSWIKLWTDILHDPKMALLPDNLWRKAVEFMLLVGLYDDTDSGIIPSLDILAWELRIPTKEQILQALEDITNSNNLIVKENNWYAFRKWSDRQSARPPSARKIDQRTREKALNDAEFVECHENVTKRDKHVTFTPPQNVTKRDKHVTQRRGEVRGEVRGEEIVNENDFQRLEDDTDLQKMISLISRTAGILSYPGDVPSLEEFIKLGVKEEDIIAALDFLQQNGKTPNSIRGLVGSVTHSRNKRIQEESVKAHKNKTFTSGGYKQA